MRRKKPASHQPDITNVAPADDAALRARCASNAPQECLFRYWDPAGKKRSAYLNTHYYSRPVRCPRARNTCPGANPNHDLYKCCRC